MTLNERERTLQAGNRYVLQTGIVILDVTAERTLAELNIGPDTLNASGRLHGGAIFTLADAASGAMARADGRRYVTECCDIHFLSGVMEGTVTATATVVRRGKRSCVVQTEITSGGRLVATATAHFACVADHC